MLQQTSICVIQHTGHTSDIIVCSHANLTFITEIRVCLCVCAYKTVCLFIPLISTVDR